MKLSFDARYVMLTHSSVGGRMRYDVYVVFSDMIPSLRNSFDSVRDARDFIATLGCKTFIERSFVTGAEFESKIKGR